AGCDQKPSNRVGAILADHFERIHRVPASLRHLLAELVQNEIVHNDVLETRLLKQERTNRMQCIEPAAGLIYTLRDEICGKRTLKDFLILERIVPLRERH